MKVWGFLIFMSTTDFNNTLYITAIRSLEDSYIAGNQFFA